MVKVYTLGYAGKNFQSFLSLLRSKGIRAVVDVRRFPTSKQSGFKKEELKSLLKQHNIEYFHLAGLGGFRGDYRAHMQSSEFKEALQSLLCIAKRWTCCLICKEVNVQHCHRRFISARLQELGIEVEHL